jgi:alkanesulfonate monooxygenase SsuD/methylene tetrahydromethanopterin reductase-like flavin-dependent oxidoreductase (luciferase family)
LTNTSLSFGAYALPSYHAETDPPQGVYMRRLIDRLAWAEALGFDAIWLNEHHFSPWGGMMPSPPVALAALSQRTSRVRLGTSVSVLALHHPVHVAEQLAMLDLISGGRLELGVGRGSAPFDHEVFGFDFSHAQARTLEALEVILQAWRGEPFSHTGTYFQVPSVQVWPRPEQRPHPPVWISCSSSRESFEWTARHGYNLLTIGFVKPVPRFAELTRAYRQLHPEGQITTLYHSVVGENGARARQQATDAIGRFLGQMLESLTLSPASAARPSPVEDLSIERMVDQARLVAGSPADVAAMLESLQREVGFTQVALMFQFGGLSDEVARESMALFAAEVMPRLRSAAPMVGEVLA